MSEVEKIIAEKIRQEGPITFETFMDMALYLPGHGYYMSEREVIGPGGDFYTSPHLHPIFGWVVAVQLDEMRRLLGAPGDFTVLEVGAGKGFLSEGILSYVERELRWRNGWRYIIVEKNPSLRRVQERVLSRFDGLVEWADSLSGVEEFCGAVVTNELIDSLPVHIVEMDGACSEIYLDVGADGLEEKRGPLSTPDLQEYIERYRIPSTRGYRTEINLKARDFLAAVEGLLTEGFVLTIDYGYPFWEYYAEERSSGTLLCYHRHTCSETPLEHVGEQDITAHVNFSALRDWGEGLGMKALGYCPQGTFLVSLGIDRLISAALSDDPGFRNEIPKIKGLLLGMGDTHKVLLQYKGPRTFGDLLGFRLRNRLNLL